MKRILDRSTIRAVVSELTLLDWVGRRPSARMAIWVALLAAYAITRAASVASPPMAFTPDGHAIASFTDTAILRRMGPSVTAATVGQVLFGIRMLIVTAFCGAVLLAGGSVLMCIGVIELGLGLGEYMMSLTYSVYPFLFVMPLLSITAYLWLLNRERATVGRADWAVLAVVGLAASLGVNVRTSHLPVYVALFALFLWFWPAVTGRRGLLAAVIVCTMYGLGHWSIVKLRPPPLSWENRSYQVVAHRLVLSLAVPENPLSRSEGIKWQDDVGLVLARRVDPSATYADASYEKALFRYYWSLWRRRPGGMAAVYLQKFNMAGDGWIETMSADSGRIWVFLKPWKPLRNGFVRLWGLTTLSIGAALAYRRRRWLFAALLAMLSVAALLLHIEAALAVPTFTILYQSFSVFYLAMMGIVATQIAVSMLAGLAMRASAIGFSSAGAAHAAAGEHADAR